jgi:hypothetical protein
MRPLTPDQVIRAERRLARALYPGLNLPAVDDEAAWDQLATQGRQMAAERGLDLERIGREAEAAVELLRQERNGS